MTQITKTDVQFRLSAPAATAGNVTAGTAGNSLGKFVSTTQISTTPMDDLFPDITGPENTALQVDYQCLFILNNTDSGNLMQAPKLWISLEDVIHFTGGATLAMGLDTLSSFPQPMGSSTPQAATISSSGAAPDGVSTWIGPTSTWIGSGNSLVLPDIPPAYVVPIWFQRTATNSSGGQDLFNVECIFSTST